MSKSKDKVRIHPLGCRCHTLAFGETSFINPDTRLPVTLTVATRSVRSVFCPSHPPHRYLQRYVSRTQS